MKIKYLVIFICAVIVLGAAALAGHFYTRDQAVVYRNDQYGFKLWTTKVCQRQFLVRPEPSTQAEPDFDGPVLDVFVPLSKQWPKDSAWFAYAVMSVDKYNEISDQDYPGKPPIVASLKKDHLLLVLPPQDGPGDIGECQLNVRAY